MNRLLISLLLVLMTVPLWAAPPYDVTVTLIAPTSGGAVDSYALTVNGVPRGALVVGVNTFADLITADGTYVFQAAATNAAGTTLSVPVTYTTSEIAPPGAPGIQIQIDCSPCVITGG